MQSKLAIWSSKDKERKFDRLLRLIAEPVWLREAARITLASSGAKDTGNRWCHSGLYGKSYPA